MAEENYVAKRIREIRESFERKPVEQRKQQATVIGINANPQPQINAPKEPKSLADMMARYKHPTNEEREKMKKTQEAITRIMAKRETQNLPAAKEPEKVPSALKASVESSTKFLDKWEIPRESRESYEGEDFIDYYVQQRRSHWGEIGLPVLLELYEQKGIQRSEKNLKIIKGMLFSSMEYAPDRDPNKFLNTTERIHAERGGLNKFMERLGKKIEREKHGIDSNWLHNFKLTMDNLARIHDSMLKAQLQACLQEIEDYMISPTTILEGEEKEWHATGGE